MVDKLCIHWKVCFHYHFWYANAWHCHAAWGLDVSERFASLWFWKYLSQVWHRKSPGHPPRFHCAWGHLVIWVSLSGSLSRAQRPGVASVMHPLCSLQLYPLVFWRWLFKMKKVTSACHARGVLPCPVIWENRASGQELCTWSFSLFWVSKLQIQLLVQTEPSSLHSLLQNRVSEYEGMRREIQVNLWAHFGFVLFFCCCFSFFLRHWVRFIGTRVSGLFKLRIK